MQPVGCTPWCSTDAKKFVDVIEPICTFFHEEGKIYEQLRVIEWKLDLIFLTGVMNHLQALTLSPEGKDKIECDLETNYFYHTE